MKTIKLFLFTVYCISVVFFVSLFVTWLSSESQYNLFYKQMVIETIKDTLPCNTRGN